MKFELKEYPHPADRFGALQALKAELKILENRVRAELLARGDDVIEGALFRVTVTETPPAEYFDPRKIRLHVPRELRAKIMSLKAGSVRINCSARKGVDTAAA